MSNTDSYDNAIRANFRRNVAANLSDLIFWTVGASFVSTSTVLPLYLRHLTDNPVLIGLIPSLQFLGWRLPQLFTANLVEKLPRKKPFVVLYCLHERLPFLFIGLFILLLPNASPSLALPVVLMLLVWQALGGGLIGAAWQEMLAKIILPNRWGLFFGVSNALGAVLGVGAAWVSSYLLSNFTYPKGFAYSYLVCFAFTVLSWISLLFIVEPAKKLTKPEINFNQYLRQLPKVVRDDHNFRNYLLLRSLAIFGTMGTGFLAVYAAERFSLGDEAAAIFTGIMLVSQAIFNPLFGHLGDRYNHKAMLTLSFAVQAASMLVAALSANPTVFMISFALKSAADAAGNSSGISIVFEFCSEEHRPTYIGLANTLTAPPLVIAPLLGGAIASSLGYVPVFYISAALGIIIAFIWHKLVQDPRRLSRNMTANNNLAGAEAALNISEEQTS